MFSSFNRFFALVAILASLLTGLASCGRDKNADTSADTSAGTSAEITTSDNADLTTDEAGDDIAKDSGWTKDFP